MTKENDQQKLQEKYVLYQLLQQNLDALQQQMQHIENQFLELSSSIQLLDDLKNIDEKNEIFLPLGSGCYGKGKIDKKSDILVNIGAGVMITKDLGSAKKFLEERQKELEKIGGNIQNQMQRVTEEINFLVADIEKLAQKIK